MKSLIHNLIINQPQLQYYLIPTQAFTPEEATAFVNNLSEANMCVINSDELQVINTEATLNAVENPQEMCLEIEHSGNVNTDERTNDDLIEFTSEIPVESETTEEPEEAKKSPFSHRNFVCVFCNESFPNAKIYKDHMQQHYKNSKVHKCEKCQSSFNSEVNYNVHLASHLEPGDNLVCPICSRIFHRVASLRCHLNIHREEEIFTCILCLQEFVSQDDYTKHIEWHRTDMMCDDITVTASVLVCPDCKYTFDNADELKTHVAKHNELKKIIYKGKKLKRRNTNTGKVHQHKCNTCDKSFVKPSLLNRHLRIHTGDRPFKCTICHLAFGQKVTLKIHLLKHDGLKPYKCSLCNANFTQKGNLRAHMEKTHTATIQNEKAYRCTQCTCIFKRVSSLNGHITKAHGEKSPANTPPNIEDSKDISDLKKNVHDASNPNIKTFNKKVVDVICNLSICENPPSELISYVKLTDSSLGIKNIKQYEIKVRSLGDAKFYCCKYCRKEFKKPSDLIRHIRIHTGEKPFKCDRCGISFSLRSTLQQHTSTHLTKRDCKCFICHKQLLSVRSLKAHIRRHLQESNRKSKELFKCTICSKVFVNAASVNKHLATHENTCDSEKVVLKEPLVETENGLVPLSSVPTWPVSLPQHVPPPLKNPYSLPSQIGIFACANCPISFSRVSSLEKHINLCHSINLGAKIKPSSSKKLNQNEPNTDGNINKITNKETQVQYLPKANAHMKSGKRSRTPRKPRKKRSINRFTCEFCGKTCASMYHLKEHLNFHTQTKNYQCHICERRFVTASILRRHLVSHSTKRPYLCPYCNRNFKFLKMCRNHIESHREDVLRAIQREQSSLDNPTITNLNLVNTMSISDPVKLNNVGDFIVAKVGNSAESSVLPPVHTINTTDNNCNTSFHAKDFIELNLHSEMDIDEKSDGIKVKDEIIVVEAKNSNVYVQQNNIGTSIFKEDNNTIYFISKEKPQILIENSTLPDIKVQNSDPLLISSVNDPEQNILYPIYPNTSAHGPEDIQQFETYNPNLIFNGTVPMHDINIADDSDKIENTGNTALGLSSIGEVSIEFQQNIKQSVIDLCNLPNNLTSATNLTLQHDIFHKITPQHEAIHVSRPIDVDKDSKIIVNDQFVNATGFYKPSEFVCATCQRIFNEIDKLENHTCKLVRNVVKNEDESKDFEVVLGQPEDDEIDVKTKSKPTYTCLQCKQKFTSKRDLTKHKDKEGHKMMRDKKNKYTCETCGKSFGKASDLLRHSRIHSGEKPFQCTECYKFFALKSTLGTHMRTHDATSSKSFICEVCHKTVSCKSSLNLHMLLHTGEKPQSCPICNERFRTVSKKRLHIQNVHVNNNSAKNNKNKKTTDILQSIVIQTNEEILKEKTQQIQELNINEKQIEVNLAPETESADPDEISSFLPLNNFVDSLNFLPNQTETIPIDPELLHELQLNGILTKDGELSSFYRIQYEIDRVTNGRILSITSVEQDDQNRLEYVTNVELDETDLNINQLVYDQRQYQSDLSIIQQEAISNHIDDLEYQNHNDEEDVLRNFMPMIEIIAREDQDVFSNIVNKNTSNKLQAFNEKIQEFDDSVGQSKNKVQMPKYRKIKRKEDKIKVDINNEKEVILKHLMEDVKNDGHLENVAPLTETGKEPEIIDPVRTRLVLEGKHQGLYNCTDCRRKFHTRSGLTKHKRTHGRGEHVCSACPRQFRTEELLTEHRRVAHEGFRPLSCPYCSNTFQRESNRKVHIKRIHKDVLLDQVITSETNR